MDYSINMPLRPRIVEEDGEKGVYEIDGLYAGYGHTLGNSLRRIILSSLPGSAITKVKIEGASHEFSNLPGIKEDVINIILNLKRLRFKMHTDEIQKATISVKGIKNITAKDIKLPTQVEILNKEMPIATLTSKDAKLEIEITIEKGLGYITREALHKERVEIGMIHLDVLFTPIRRVNYEVENMRVGDRTDYNRLRFFIQTDGSVSPKEALEKSIEIMISHLRSIRGFQETEIEEDLEEEKIETDKEIDKKIKKDDTEILKTRIEDLPLSSRTAKALTISGIRTLGGLARKKESDLLEIEDVGKKAVEEIKEALENYGLSLK
ncbi:DNA-directed RNA polymerase subunit alpha [Patescibacteria group bacterium]|nr:DNA-directed RNA polymerase subunit alpha [Patescibacteria group bacterium]